MVSWNIPRPPDKRVREHILFERREYQKKDEELKSEFMCFRQFWVLLLPKVPEGRQELE